MCNEKSQNKALTMKIAGCCIHTDKQKSNKNTRSIHRYMPIYTNIKCLHRPDQVR